MPPSGAVPPHQGHYQGWTSTHLSHFPYPRTASIPPGLFLSSSNCHLPFSSYCNSRESFRSPVAKSPFDAGGDSFLMIRESPSHFCLVFALPPFYGGFWRQHFFGMTSDLCLLICLLSTQTSSVPSPKPRPLPPPSCQQEVPSASHRTLSADGCHTVKTVSFSSF